MALSIYVFFASLTWNVARITGDSWCFPSRSVVPSMFPFTWRGSSGSTRTLRHNWLRGLPELSSL